MLTNKPSEIVQFKRKKLSEEDLYNKIEESLARTVFITANTPKQQTYSKGIVKNHSY